MSTSRANRPEVRVVKIGLVKPSQNHARTHNKQQRKKLENQIRHYGQISPLIVDEDLNIIDGHLVYELLQDLGHDEIYVVIVSGHTEAEIRALRLALNRIPQDAGWDKEKLRAEFQHLIDVKFDLDMTGFSAVEIDLTLEINEADSEPEVPSLEVVAITQPGDIWILGQHRIACGDARDPSLMQMLTEGSKCAMAFIDPPYNVKIDGHVSGNGNTKHREFAMASGEMSEAQFTDFLSRSLQNLKNALLPGAAIFACMDWRHLVELLTAGRKTDLELANLCVWTKPTPGLGTFYRSQHELVAVFKSGGGESRNNMALAGKRRNRSNVWPYRGMNSFGDGRDELVKLHPTVKPVALVADAIRDVSVRGEAIIDSFLGSGTSLIAAEETGRICYGAEVDPLYVDVAIRRWQQATGKDALLMRTGEMFFTIAKRRAAELSETANV